MTKRFFNQALTELAIILAKSIARDGEGATKLIEVTVKGTSKYTEAKHLARSLTISPLIKTAISGQSPNWGRVLARIGSEQIPIQLLNYCSISIQDITLFSAGVPAKIDINMLKHKMKEDVIKVLVDFNTGEHAATAWGCDLTEKYVKINAEYLT